MSQSPLLIKTVRPIRFVNVGEDPPNPLPDSGWIGRRQWKACIKYGFLSAGQGVFYSRPFENLQVGDVIAAFITGEGYVGIGKVLKQSIRINKFLHNGKSLKGLNYVRDTLFDNSDDYNPKSEHVIKVEWIITVEKEQAHWVRGAGLFASRLTQCNLENQPETIEFIEDAFNVKFV